MRNKHPPQIYKDRRGREWITAEGLRRYYGISVPEVRPYWYLLAKFERMSEYDKSRRAT